MALRALPCHWAHLAGVSGGVNLYTVSIIIIKIYPALSAAVWGVGWDGSQQAPLDDVFYLWNTSSITALRAHSHHWGHWAIFFLHIYTYISSYNIAIPYLPFTMPQGRRE
jgi:hypothetical protein